MHEEKESQEENKTHVLVQGLYVLVEVTHVLVEVPHVLEMTGHNFDIVETISQDLFIITTLLQE